MTSFAHCWTLGTRDGAKTVRATDHDRALLVSGEVFKPGLALESSVIRETLRPEPEPLDLEGALHSEGLTADDLSNGVWDGARVTIWRVNWNDTGDKTWLWSGYLSEIESEGGSFRVRLASQKADLERTIGRVFGRRCDAALGDARCGVDLGSAPQQSCDKRFSTCRDDFANAENFRGFPHMPGNDVLVAGPGDARKGGSRGIER